MARGFRIGYPRAYRISGDQGAYTIDGVDAILRRGFTVAAAQGSYTISGQSATLSTVASSVTAPVTTAFASAYRYEQPYLFQTAPEEQVPITAPYVARAAVDNTVAKFGRNTWSPVGKWINKQCSWENLFGDYTDLNGIPQGPTPSMTGTLNSGLIDHVINATSIVKQSQTLNRPLAMKWNLTPTTTRNIAGKHSDNPPRLSVVYTDGTTEDLVCRLTATNDTSTDTASFGAASYRLIPGMFVEFSRPKKPVFSASLTVRVTAASATNATMRGYLLTPRVNTSPTQSGIAAAQSLDAGMPSHPSVICAQRYLDSAVITDFISPIAFANTNAENAFDPAIYGPSPQDLTKLPHALISAPSAISTGHKWTGFPTAPVPVVPVPNGSDTTRTELVKSTYTGEGFVPVAPGMGAIKVTMHPMLDVNGLPIHNGSFVGESGTGVTGRLYFKDEHFGLVQDLYVREYIRIGTPTGGPYVDTLANRFEVHQSESSPGVPAKGSEIVWTDKGGKFGMVADHNCNPRGGFSATSGSQFGWQARMSWTSVDETEAGPLEGGWMVAFHSFDFASNPKGNFARSYSYGALDELGNLGHGGMNMFYAHRWYCMEIRHRLNTVTPYYPGFIDDGIMQMWVDGRHIITKNNLVFRQKPAWRGFNSVGHSTALGQDQWAEITASGFAAGEGYVGACVRHNLVNGGAVQFYTTVLSRFSATQAVIGLARRDRNAPIFFHLAKTDPIAWADGDRLRIWATGAEPTTLRLYKNWVGDGSDVPLTIFWHTAATTFKKPVGPTDDPNTFVNPASTSMVTATSYVDTEDHTINVSSTGVVTQVNELHLHRNTGMFACNNSLTNGLRIDSWRAGDGVTTLSDNFDYPDSELAVTGNPAQGPVANTAYHYCDSATNVVATPKTYVVSPLLVRGGAVYCDPLHKLDRTSQLLAARDIGHRGLLMNWFHGGQTRNAEQRTLFYSGLVAATEYIGPMNGYPSGVDGPQLVPTSTGDLTSFASALSLTTAPKNTWLDSGIVAGSVWAVRSMIPGARDADPATQLGGGGGTSGESFGNATALADDTLVNSNGAAWFPTKKQFFFMGGGHGGWPGNETYCVDVPSRKWVRLDDPSPLVYAPLGDGTDNWDTTDGRPKSAHTYDGLVGAEERNELWMLHGSPWPQGDYIGDLWKYSLTTRQWTKVLTQPMSPLPAYEPHLYWIPSLGKLLMGWRRYWRFYDPATGVLGPVTPGTQADIGLSTGVIAPAHGTRPAGMYQFWNPLDLSSGNVDFLPLVNVGVSAPTNIISQFPQFAAHPLWPRIANRWNSYVWDPVRQMVIAWDNWSQADPTSGKNVYAIDFANGRLFQFVTAGSTWPRNEALGSFTKWQYLPDVDGYIGLNNRARTGGWKLFLPGAMTQIA